MRKFRGAVFYVLGLFVFTGASVLADPPAHFLSLQQRAAKVVAENLEPTHEHPVTQFPPPHVRAEVGAWLFSLEGLSEDSASFWKPIADKASARREIYQYVLDQVWVPELTQEEYEHFSAEVVRRGGITQITGPISGFWAPRPVISIGLAAALLGHLPAGLNQGNFIGANAWGNALMEWREHPELPALYMSLEDAEAVALEIDRQLGLTGSSFQVPTDQELELLIRGRDRFGHVTVSDFYFGNLGIEQPPFGRVPCTRELQKQLWCGNGKKLGVRQRPSQRGYVNSYGIIHPVGNAIVKSLEGNCIGVAYNAMDVQYARSGASRPCNAQFFDHSALRLIEKRTAQGR